MRFAFLAAEPVHESVPLFASLLRARGHDVDVVQDGRRFLTEPGDALTYDLAWYRFSPGSDRAVPDLSWETLLAFESVGVRILNSPQSLLLARNKFLSAIRFQRSGLAQPETELLCEDEPHFRPPYIVKPCFGALSEGVAVVDSHQDALERALHRGPYVIQRYVAGAQVRRVITGKRHALLVRDKLLDLDGAYAPPRPPTEAETDLCEFALKMTRAVGGDMMGADVLVHESDLYALEVNGGFGFAAAWLEAGEAIASEFERISREPRRSG